MSSAAIPASAVSTFADLPLVRSVQIFCLYAAREQGAYAELTTWLALYLRAGLVELAGSGNVPQSEDPEPFCTEQIFQAPSLFGLEEWTEGNQEAERIHGCSAGRITLRNGQGELRLGPRRMVANADSMRGMDRDTRFHLDEEGALSMTFPITTGRA